MGNGKSAQTFNSPSHNSQSADAQINRTKRYLTPPTRIFKWFFLPLPFRHSLSLSLSLALPFSPSPSPSLPLFPSYFSLLPPSFPYLLAWNQDPFVPSPKPQKSTFFRNEISFLTLYYKARYPLAHPSHGILCHRHPGHEAI